MNTKLLKNLDFAKLLNESKAITAAGNELLQNYKGYLYTNPVSCGLVNGFIKEASNFSFDTGLVGIVESVNKFISENNVSWRLASACESISANNSKYNYINQIGVNQVEKLLEMDESDVVSYIKAGSLKGIMYIPEFRAIVKSVYKTQINEHKAVNYNVHTPISYVCTSDNDQYFNVLGRTFKVSDNEICEAHCDDVVYNRMNKILENFTVTKDNELVYEMQGVYGEKAKFTINDDSIKFEANNGNVNECFTSSTALREYANTISRPMRVQEKLNFLNVSNMIADVFESFDNVRLLDNVKVLNCSNGTVCAIIEGKDNVNLTVRNSVTVGSTSKNYGFIAEALNDVIKVTGIDLKFMYEDRIDEDCKKKNTEEQNIREELAASKEAQISIRKRKIAQLAESYKNDPVRIALLNKVAKELSLLEKN